jgi:hypothetical protein
VSFITPTFLFAAAAAVLPVIYHLIRKMRARKVKFSSLLFLKATPKALIKRRKLRDIVLLILRTCIFGLLALVFARPFFPQKSLPVVMQADDSSTVILLDVSYSMQYDDRLEKAKSEALKIIGDLNGLDEIAIVAFSDHAEQVAELSGDGTLLRSAVNGTVKASNRTTDFYQPLRLAAEILKNARHQRRSVVLISDFQKNGWSGQLDNWRLDGDITFVPIRVGNDQSGNSYINQAVIDQRRIGAVETAQFKLQVLSKDSENNTGREVTLWLNNKNIGSKTSEQLHTSQVVFQQDNLREGTYQGRFVLTNDKLMVDNTRYFSFAITKRPSIVCFDGSPSSPKSNAFFLSNCFSLGDRSRYDFKTAVPDNITTPYLREFDIVFLADLPSLSDRQIRSIREYCERGGAVVISFGDRMNRDASAHLLSELGIGVLTDRIDARLSRNASAIVSTVDVRHPVFSVFVSPGAGDISMPRFHEYAIIQPDTAAVVVARFDTNDPFLIDRAVGKGKALVMASSFNTEWSDFPANDIFLPFVYQLVKYGLSSGMRNNSFDVGDQVLFNGSSGDDWEVRTPEGKIIKVTIDKEGIGWFRDTEVPGNYQAEHGSEQHNFSVNVDTRESDFEVKDEAEVAAVLTGGGDRSDGGNVITNEKLVEEEKNQKLWRYVLLLIIMLFVAETYLANRKMSIAAESQV